MKGIPTQLNVALLILLFGGGVLAGEYLLVKWYPLYQQRVRDETLKLVPYRNDALGIEMQVAAGIFEKVESFPGGVKIQRPMFWRVGPSLTITSQPNLDRTFEFAPQAIAKWETEGVYQEIPRYHFSHTNVNNRDTVLIWQLKARSMVLTARVLSSERLIEADCTPGQADEALYLEACEASVRSIKVAGPEPPPPPQEILELTPSQLRLVPKR